MTIEQLNQSRAEVWRQGGNPLLTADDATAWLRETGVCLFLPRGQQLPTAAPSFVEATLGAPSPAPAPEAVDAANELLRRLVSTGDAVALHLITAPASAGLAGDQPDFLATPETLPFLFALRGDKEWKRGPRGKSSPLTIEVWKLLGAEGALTAEEVKDKLGRQLTEAAALRALVELWSHLRVEPLYTEGEPTRWQLLEKRRAKQMQAGSTLSQAVALSALVSLYLQSAVAASGEEIEVFLSPVASRSKVRDVVKGLTATRQLGTRNLGPVEFFHVEGSLPEFPEIARPEGATLDTSTEIESAEQNAGPGEGRKRFVANRATAAGAGEERGGEREQRGPRIPPAGRPAAREDGRVTPRRAPAKDAGERRPFAPGRKSAGGDERRPYGTRSSSTGGAGSFNPREPWKEDRKPREEGSGDRRPFAGRKGEDEGTPRQSFGGERKSFAPRAGGERKPFAPGAGSRGGSGDRPFKPRAGAGDDRKPYTPREGAGGERSSFAPRGGSGDRPFQSRAAGGGPTGERRPFTPREGGDRKPFAPRGGSGDRPYKPRSEGGAGGERKSFGDRKPYAPREGVRDAGGERKSFAPRGGSGDRPYKPRTGAGPNGSAGGERESFGGSRKPYAPREGAGAERKPFGGDRKPFAPRGGGSSGDRPYKPRTGAGGGGERKPYTPREGGRPSGGGERKSFGDRKPFTPGEPREGGERKSFAPRPAPTGTDRPAAKKAGGFARPGSKAPAKTAGARKTPGAARPRTAGFTSSGKPRAGAKAPGGRPGPRAGRLGAKGGLRGAVKRAGKGRAK